MRIASTGDLHYGAGVDEDIASSMKQFRQTCAMEKADKAVLTGDLFDRKSDPATRNRLVMDIMLLADLVPVSIVYGNHDHPGDLDVLDKLNTKHPIHVFSRPAFERPDGLKALLYYLPWVTKSSWLAERPLVSIEEANRSVSQQVAEYLKTVVAVHGNLVEKHILVAHLTIHGAKAENHQPMIGEGVTVGEADLLDAGFDWAILGHIHLSQSFQNGRFFYNGSPAPLNYGESPKKCFSILDTDAGVVEWHTFQTIDRYTIDLSWDGAGVVSWAFDEARVKGARVRVKLMVPEGSSMELVRRMVTDMIGRFEPLELKIEHQVVPKEQLRAERITLAESNLQKLQVYWETVGYPSDPFVQEKMVAGLDKLEEQCALLE